MYALLNMKKVRQLFFVMLSMHCISLHSMEIAESEDNKKLLEIIAYNVPHGDYDLHRTLSLMNVACHKAVEDTYRSDKKRIEQTIYGEPMLRMPQPIIWNKDFTQCAWVTVENNPSVYDEKSLELNWLRLKKKNRKPYVRIGLWQGYKYPAIDETVRPFFDKSGGVFCYGFGSFDRDYHDTILEYSLNSNGEMKCKKCCFLPQYCCKNFLNFPILLKAILRSTQVKEFVRYEVIDKTYKIEGVTIPDDYKTFKQHPFHEDKRLSYDQLNDCLKKVIDERYAQQQGEKAMIENK